MCGVCAADVPSVGVGVCLAVVDAGEGGVGHMLLIAASSLECSAQAGTWGRSVIAVAMPVAEGDGTGCDTRC